jgi:eukaryotic-like serine/threonine-protein kinase
MVVEPAPGLMVTDSLRLVTLLGEGGMGSVWVADHLGLDTRVAVKFITVDVTKNPRLLERFKREAALAARIRSPHVVQMLDHGVAHGDVPYIAPETPM